MFFTNLFLFCIYYVLRILFCTFFEFFLNTIKQIENLGPMDPISTYLNLFWLYVYRISKYIKLHEKYKKYMKVKHIIYKLNVQHIFCRIAMESPFWWGLRTSLDLRMDSAENGPHQDGIIGRCQVTVCRLLYLSCFSCFGFCLYLLSFITNFMYFVCVLYETNQEIDNWGPVGRNFLHSFVSLILIVL